MGRGQDRRRRGHSEARKTSKDGSLQVGMGFLGFEVCWSGLQVGMDFLGFGVRYTPMGRRPRLAEKNGRIGWEMT